MFNTFSDYWRKKCYFYFLTCGRRRINFMIKIPQFRGQINERKENIKKFFSIFQLQLILFTELNLQLERR